MVQKQKEKITALLKDDSANERYEKGYWFSYQDFLDPTDDFTAFSCENLDGKQGYLTLIEKLLHTDETAKVFVEVYGMEEEENGPVIYAETLIIFSKLSLVEIEQIFNEPKDIFPSAIGEWRDYHKQTFILDKNGTSLPVGNGYDSGYSVYYCWWD